MLLEKHYLNSILFVSTTFTSSIAPRLSALFHSSNITGFNSAFDKSFRRSVIGVIGLTQLLVLLVYLVHCLVGGFSDRFLPWDQLQVYSLTVIMSAIVYCWSIYLRSQSIEPLMFQSVITALAMAPAIWFSSLISINSMLLSMALISGLSTVAAWRIYSGNRQRLL